MAILLLSSISVAFHHLKNLYLKFEYQIMPLSHSHSYQRSSGYKIVVIIFGKRAFGKRYAELMRESS